VERLLEANAASLALVGAAAAFASGTAACSS
jgi:hypothetical protein